LGEGRPAKGWPVVIEDQHYFIEKQLEHDREDTLHLVSHSS
jgi:hypothetical protein